MAFISNKERNNKIKKLHNTNHGKKIWVSISLIIAIVFMALILVIGLLPIFPDNISNVFNNLIGSGDWFVEGGKSLTKYGYIMVGSISLTTILLLSSLITFFSMKSVSWGFKKTVDLISSPVPGKSGKVSKKAKSVIKDRIKYKKNK